LVGETKNGIKEGMNERKKEGQIGKKMKKLWRGSEEETVNM